MRLCWRGPCDAGGVVTRVGWPEDVFTISAKNFRTGPNRSVLVQLLIGVDTSQQAQRPVAQ